MCALALLALPEAGQGAPRETAGVGLYLRARSRPATEPAFRAVSAHPGCDPYAAERTTRRQTQHCQRLARYAVEVMVQQRPIPHARSSLTKNACPLREPARRPHGASVRGEGPATAGSENACPRNEEARTKRRKLAQRVSTRI